MNKSKTEETEKTEVDEDSKRDKKETFELNDTTNKDLVQLDDKEECSHIIKELEDKIKVQNQKFKKFKEKTDQDLTYKSERIKELEKIIKDKEKEINEKDKTIYNLNISNSKLMSSLEELKKEVDDQLDKVSIKNINNKMKKPKENPLEIVLKLKEKELKNKVNLLEILRKDNEQLNKTLENNSNIKVVMELQDKLKVKEKENNDLQVEIKALNKQLEEHKKCTKLKTQNEEEFKNLRDELKKAKESSKESQLKLKDEESKHSKTKDILINLRREVENNKRNKIETENSLKKINTNGELKKIVNFNHDANINIVLEEEKSSKNIKIKLEDNNSEQDKIEKKIEALENSKKSLENRLKSDIKLLNKKVQQKDEQIEYVTGQFREIEQKNKILQFQITEYKNEQKVYQRKINEFQTSMESNNNLIKEKEQEINILIGQLSSLKKLVKHNAVPPMDKEVVKYIEKIKNDDNNNLYITDIKKNEESQMCDKGENTQESLIE